MRVPVVVIGGGQAGLAMSHCLSGRSIDHIVLERGAVANSWRSERWDSLRLLTPNWMSRLPGFEYRGDDPDGFMTKNEVIDFLEEYRQSITAPVLINTTVESVQATANGFEVTTNQGHWACSCVVVATGSSSEPRVPEVASQLPSGIQQLNALQYRNPEQLDSGEVLVVGASASGAQIADELHRSGRPVTLAVGDHVRLPRQYRGRDIHWWMDAIGQLDERYDEVDDLTRARRLPSLQLIGTPERRTLDLNALISAGVGIVGKFMNIAGTNAQFSGSPAHLIASADLKQNRLLDRIDEFALELGIEDQLPRATRPARTRLGAIPSEMPVDRFATVVWATGYRPSYSWLDPAAFDHRGQLAHDGGVGDLPGLYLLGQPFMRRRKSSFIDGVGPDAIELTASLCSHLDRLAGSRASGSRLEMGVRGGRSSFG